MLLRTLDVFRQNTNPDYVRHRLSHARNAGNGLELPRRLRRTRIVEYVLQHTVGADLEKLRGARGELAALLNAGQRSLGYAALAQRIGQQVRGRDRILDCQIDADPAHWRHRVRCVTNAQQTRPMPLPQPIDLHRQQLDLIPILQFLDPLAEMRSDASYVLAKSLNPVLLYLFKAAFGMTCAD